MMPKDELSVLKIDFVKLRMALNCSSVQKYSLLQLFSNIRRIKKSLIKEINEVFDINYNNIEINIQLINYKDNLLDKEVLGLLSLLIHIFYLLQFGIVVLDKGLNLV